VAPDGRAATVALVATLGLAADAALHEASEGIRASIRSLRPMLVEIYPPSLQRAGLPAALQDLVAPLEGRGVAATLVVPEVVPAGRQTAEIVFRVAQEALRNVIAHSKANSVELTVAHHDDWLVLTVTDDGIGFEPDALAAALAGGHVGLRLLRDLSQAAGGTLDVTSAPGEGTRVRLEVPHG
jgi:two-component system, NarL family, sensor kinase